MAAKDTTCAPTHKEEKRCRSRHPHDRRCHWQSVAAAGLKSDRSLSRLFMALGKTIAFQSRAFAIMLVVMAGSVTCGPASAQYWGDRSSGGWGGWGWGDRSSGGWGDRGYYRRSPHRDFRSPFSGERRNRPAPTVDYSKAPPPRKLDKPPSQTVVVIGDSMADWLGYGLDESYAEQPEIGVERKIRATSGLVRYDAKNEALDWPQAAKDALLNAKPNAIVVMLGLNDRVPLSEKVPAQPKRNGEPAQGANQSAARLRRIKPRQRRTLRRSRKLPGKPRRNT